MILWLFLKRMPLPHALTSTEDGRVLSYDDNGNMTTLEGATLTWDFKDRLVRYQKDNVDAHYIYDYTDRRIIKSVSSSELSAPSVAKSTTYVDKLFEIRDYETPTKYAFSGSVRLARFTKFMNVDGDKTQWLKLKEGWNFISLYVQPADNTATSVVDLGGNVVSAWRFNNATSRFVSIAEDDPLTSGQAYMVFAREESILKINGSPLIPGPFPLAVGDQSITWPLPRGLRPAKDLVDISNSVDAVWGYTNTENLSHWTGWFPSQPSYLSDLSQAQVSGSANIFSINGQSTINIPQTHSEDIRFYHGDHLGSTNIVTDGNGKLAEETVFYPFGYPRNKFVTENERLVSEYRFTGKEQDFESDLQYFEARYLIAILGRFANVDPLDDGDYRPNKNGNYLYAANNCLRYTDPNGEAILTASIFAIGMIIGSYPIWGPEATNAPTINPRTGNKTSTDIPGTSAPERVFDFAAGKITGKFMGKGIEKIFPTKMFNSPLQKIRGTKSNIKFLKKKMPEIPERKLYGVARKIKKNEIAQQKVIQKINVDREEAFVDVVSGVEGATSDISGRIVVEPIKAILKPSNNKD